MQWGFDPQIYCHIHAYFTSYKLYNAFRRSINGSIVILLIDK